jgi:hypothetical protein
MKKVFLAVTLLLLLLASTSAFAQVTASLSGTVSDATGALIPGVEVTAKNTRTGITTTNITNESGSYVILALQPGTYTLTAALTGFKTSAIGNIELGEGQAVRFNLKLEVGAAAGTTVEVNVAADTVLATTSASVGNVLTDQAILSAPLATRNVLDLIATSAGVVFTPNTFAPHPGEGFVANFGGTGVGAVNTTRDGLVTNDGRYNNSNGAYSGVFTSPDMVEEVKITANNIDPTLGRGAAQVQMRTRAGTNDFHGAGFYTNNNSAMNAQTWFNNFQNAPKNYLNRNQYGARIGGPIIKNKAFFFVLTDNQRFLDKTTVNAVVLTPTAQQGIFRFMNNGSRNGNAVSTAPSVDRAGNPLNPAAVSSFNLFSDVKDPFRTGIDQTWIAPQYFTRMPAPNNYLVGDGLNTAGFQWLRPEAGLDGSTGASPDSDRNHLTARVDYQINNKNKVSFTMTREKDWGVTQQTGEPDFPKGQFGQESRLPYFYTGSFTSTISATMLNEFRIGKKRDTWIGNSSVDQGCCISASESTRTAAGQALYSSYPQVPNSLVYMGQVGALGLGNYAIFNVASPRITISPFTQIGDTFSFTKGAHSFSVGFDFDWAGSYGANSGNSLTTRPQANLGISTSVPSLITAAQPYAKGINASDITTASNLLATLAGSISSMSETFYIQSPTQTAWTDYTKDFLFYRYQHENDGDIFFKDNWKARKDLTVLLGFRWDKYGVPYDSFGLGGRFYSSFGHGQAGLFGCSGGSFAVMWQQGAGDCGTANPSLTAPEFVGKGSPKPDSLIHPNDWKDFGPSIGFSYQVPKLGNTVLRGGYGINFAAAADFLTFSGDFGSFPGNSLGVTQSSFPTLPGGYMSAGLINSNQGLFPLSTGGTLPNQVVPLNTAGVSRVSGITGYADNWRAPYIQSFNLVLQHQLTRTVTFDVGWVGNKAGRLLFAHALNDVNVQTNGLLDAFNAVRAGGESTLLNSMFQGLAVPGVGTVNGTTLTAGQALRKYTSMNGFIANGQVGAFANFINTNTAFGGTPGKPLLNAGLPQNFIVVSPQWSSVTLRDNSGNSTYNAFQAHVSKRFSQGVAGQFSYTFSKNLGDAGVRDQRNFNLDKGILSANRTHIVTSNVTFDLPFGQNKKFFAGAPGWMDRVINGWQVSSIATWTSGAPLTWNTGNTGGLYNSAQNSPDLVGKLPKGNVVKCGLQVTPQCPLGQAYVTYWSGLTTPKAPLPNFGGDASLPGVFTNQVLQDASGSTIMQNAQPGRLGTMPFNLPGVNGPGLLLFNMSATKTVKITEGTTFTLRADAVNVLNTPQWSAPSVNFNGTTFGRIMPSALSPGAFGNRTVTLNARFDF